VFGNRLHETRVGTQQCIGPDTMSYTGPNVLVRTSSPDCLRTSHYWTDNAGNRLVQMDTTAGCYIGCPQQIMSYTAKSRERVDSGSAHPFGRGLFLGAHRFGTDLRAIDKGGAGEQG